jgi:hypothetical protein
MISSSVEACNYALTLLGEGRITSLDQSHENAVLCNLLFEPVIDEAIRKHRWNFALCRQDLAELNETNMTEYDYVYQLPLSPYCLKVLAITSDSDGDYEEQPEEDYIVEGRKLYTSLASAHLLYLGRITETKEWDSLFSEYYVYLLASKLAYRISQSFNTIQFFEAEAQRRLVEAKALDGEEGTQRPTAHDWWVDEG